MRFITINTASEFICFLAALIFLFKDKEPAWKLFIPYLLITCIVETTGIYLHSVVHKANYILYNVFLLFECGIISHMFFYLYKIRRYKTTVLLIWPVVFILMYVSELVLTKFKGFVSTTAAIMSVVFVLACLNYYYIKLKEEASESLALSAPFWWVSGALFFYFGSTTCNVFFNFLSHSQITISGYSIRYLIFNLLDIILYLFWSYAFLCRYLQRKSFT
ncbi:MAG TPA: hypothetical protein VIM77_00015 [Mucilaginibacter sp.]